MTEQTRTQYNKLLSPMARTQYNKLLSPMAGMTTGSRKSLGTYNCSLGTYSIDPKGNDESLERSYQTEETRRSSVQIRPTPPKLFLTKKPLLSI